MIDKDSEETEDTQDEATEKEADVKSESDRIARLEAENQEMRGVTQRSLEEAAAARGQVSVILEQIQRAANAGNVDAQKQVKSLRDKFDEDPVAAMNELVTLRVGPIVQEYFGRTADTEREAARQQHGKMFDKYADEIDEFMRDMPLDVKAKPGSYTAALKYVRSQHLEEEVEEARKQERERASQPEGASLAETESRKSRPVSREEREIMKAFEMTEDDWSKWGTADGTRPRKEKGRSKAA